VQHTYTQADASALAQKHIFITQVVGDSTHSLHCTILRSSVVNNRSQQNQNNQDERILGSCSGIGQDVRSK